MSTIVQPVEVSPARIPAGTTSPAPPSRIPTARFGDTLRAETIKFWTVRGTRWSLIAMVVLGVGLTTAVCWGSADWLAGDDADEVPASFVTWGAMVAQIPAIVLGALVITSEYGTGLIRATFTATPQRGRVVAAKAIVLTAALLVAGTITAVGGYLAGNWFLTDAGVGVPWSADGLVRALFGTVVVLALMGLLAFATGILVRHTAAAISIVLGTVAVIANLAWALPGEWGATIAKVIPGNSTQGLTSVVPFNPDTLGPWTGLAALIVPIAALLTVGVYTLSRRDA